MSNTVESIAERPQQSDRDIRTDKLNLDQSSVLEIEELK
jgi:hypothetical protein